MQRRRRWEPLARALNGGKSGAGTLASQRLPPRRYRQSWLSAGAVVPAGAAAPPAGAMRMISPLDSFSA